MSTFAFRTRAQLTPAIEALHARGATMSGATQFLRGEPIGAESDREQLARILYEACVPSRNRRSATSERQRLATSLVALGVSATEAHAFAGGYPVASPAARKRLAEIGMAAVNRQADGTKTDWLNLTYSNKPVPKT